MSSSHNKLDLTGQRYGKLLVIREEPSSAPGEPRWYCKCDCGSTTIKTTHSLRSSGCKSCGCLHREILSKDITGKRFGRLIAVKLIGYDSRRSALWECKCDCGNTITLVSSALISGNTRSCGCLAKDIAREKVIARCTKYLDKDSFILSRRLLAMKNRCNNPNSLSYRNYGGRGIKVCPEWEKSTQAFIDWSRSHGFRPDLTIDRINNDGPYSPDNCRWVSYLVQSNNRRNNRLFTIRGVTLSVARWLYALKMPLWYHKEIYSEPDHIISHILITRLNSLIVKYHCEDIKDLNSILKIIADKEPDSTDSA